MLRIVILHETTSTTLKLEGRLMSDWVAEAHRAWTEASENLDERQLNVDLLGLTFVDELGRDLLCTMHACGARLIGTGPMISGVIEEIEAERLSAARKSFLKTMFVLISVVLVLAFLGMPPNAWFE